MDLQVSADLVGLQGVIGDMECALERAAVRMFKGLGVVSIDFRMSN